MMTCCPARRHLDSVSNTYLHGRWLSCKEALREEAAMADAGASQVSVPGVGCQACSHKRPLVSPPAARQLPVTAAISTCSHRGVPMTCGWCRPCVLRAGRACRQQPGSKSSASRAPGQSARYPRRRAARPALGVPATQMAGQTALWPLRWTASRLAGWAGPAWHGIDIQLNAQRTVNWLTCAHAWICGRWFTSSAWLCHRLCRRRCTDWGWRTDTCRRHARS